MGNCASEPKTLEGSQPEEKPEMVMENVQEETKTEEEAPKTEVNIHVDFEFISFMKLVYMSVRSID